MGERQGQWLRLALIIAAGCGALGGTATRGAENAPALAILETGWKTSPAAFEAALKQHEKLSAGAARDTRTSYAMTLVAIRHRHARDAARFIDETLAARPKNLHLRRARLWILVWNRDYKTALAEIPAFAQDMVAGADDAAQAEAIAEQSLLLGTLLAYLRGPAEGALDARQVGAVEQQIREILPLAALEKFSEGQASVDEMHQQLSQELEQARIDAKADNDAKLAAELAKFQQAREVYKQQAEQIPPLYEQRSAMLTAHLEKLQINNRVSYRRDSKGVIERSGGSNDRAIAETQQQMVQLAARTEAETARLQKQDANAELKVGRLEKQIKQSADSLVSENSQSATARKRLTALSTYAEFPLEAERTKLSASFHKP